MEHVVFEEVFPDPLEVFAGVKAVYGPMLGHFLCFGGDSAGTAARNAGTRPWVICVAAGKANDKRNVGRVLNLVQLNNIHGPTTRRSCLPSIVVTATLPRGLYMPPQRRYASGMSNPGGPA